MIKQKIEQATQKAFADLGVDPALGSVKVSDRPDLCDYQCNGALAAAKHLQRAPREIATELQATLNMPGITIDVMGPGFINFIVTPAFLINTLASMINDPSMGVTPPTTPQTIVIDYGGPNAAKPMHVGHLRSSIIGESIKRLLRHKGHKVIGDIHLGDWGTQMGMLICGLKEIYPDLPQFQEGYTPSEAGVESVPFTLNDLEVLYPKISARTKEDAALLEQCRRAIFELQQGHAGYRSLWRHIVDLSIEDMKRQFEKLGVTFDQWFGESRYQEALAPMVRSLLDQQIAQNDNGAVIIPVAQEGDTYEIPPLLLQKSDGGYLYATTDLATLQERVQDFDANRVIYVVDGRQSLHFEQVFRGAHKMGLTGQFDFLGFGTMNGPDNRPFKTRAGGVMRLSDLMDQLQEAALEKMSGMTTIADVSAEEQSEIALQIGIAALKFADLQHDARQNYQFSLEKFMRFEGKTGPYIQYAAVRIASLMEKASTLAIEPALPTPQQEWEFMPEEKTLALSLARFPEFFQRACDNISPQIICEAVFELAQNFSRFYQQCPILKEADPTLQSGRLALCALALRQITLYLTFLGITVPPRM